MKRQLRPARYPFVAKQHMLMTSDQHCGMEIIVPTGLLLKRETWG